MTSGIDLLAHPFPWSQYSQKLIRRIIKPRSSGRLDPEEAKKRALRFVQFQEGSIEGGDILSLFWFVDPEDGIIVDAKFLAFGKSALIGALDGAIDQLIGKNYDQARRISADLIDKSLRDRESEPAFPKETFFLLNMVISAIDGAAEKCLDLPLPASYVAMPAPLEIGEVLENGIPGFMEMGVKEKIALIDTVLDRDVRPYIALDAGGVEVINLLNGHEVIISYSGSCTSCYASVGTTLSYIQQVLRAKVHPDLVVIPNM